MLDIRVKDANFLPSLLKGLQGSLGGELKKSNKEHSLISNNGTAAGNIRCSSFKDGLGFMDFDITFKDDVAIAVDTSEVNKRNIAY